MNFNQWLIGNIVLFFSPLAVANSCGVVGKVNEVVANFSNNESAYIVRSRPHEQQQISVYPYQWICNGDRFEITGNAQIHVILAKGERKIFTQQDSGQVLHEQTVDNINDNQNRLLGKIGSALSVWKNLERPRKSIPFFSNVRGISYSQLAREDPLLPIGIQFIPNGYEKIALLWKGSPATAVLTSAGKTMEFQSGNWTYLFMTLPAIQTENTVHLQGQNIIWHIKAEINPPVPEGIEESDLSTPWLQLNRAIWILQQHNLRNWRLFALSELARLSEAGFFSAEELWKAALSGELASAL